MPTIQAQTPESLRREAADLQRQADERFQALGNDYTPEQFAEVDALVKRVEDLRSQANSLEAEEQRRNDLAERLRRNRESVAAAANAQPQGEERGGNRESRIEVGRDHSATFTDFLCQIGRTLDPFHRSDADHRLRTIYGSERKDWSEAPNGTERRTLAQNSGVTGGYTVPTDFYNQLMQVASESSLVRPRATVINMTADEITIPVLDQTTAPSAGDSAFFGGMVFEWTADTDSKPETEPKFRQAKLSAHELSGYTLVNKTLLQNSAVSVEGLLRNLFGQGIAWTEDYAFLRGNGVGKPYGIVPWIVARSGAVTSARGSASAISFANARSVWVKRLITRQGSTAWLLSKAAEDAFLNMTGTANTVVVPTSFVVTGTNGSGAAQQPINYALMGLPVLVTEKLPALNTLGDFMLADLSQYIIGNRGSMEIAASEHYEFRKNAIAYRVIHRVAGMPWMDDAVTLPDATTKVSPFVGLQVQ